MSRAFQNQKSKTRVGKPATAETLHAGAFLDYSEGNFKSALDSLEQVARQRPTNAGCIADTGHVLWAMGLVKEAASAFERATRLDPTLAEAFYNLGAAHQHQGRRNEATEAFRQAVLLKPALGMHKLRNAFGRWIGRPLPVLVDSGAWALADRPELAQARLRMAAAAERDGNHDAAILEHHRALLLAPELVEAHVGLGKRAREQGNVAEAEARYRQALAIDVTCAEAHHHLGALFMARGDVVEAERRYRRSLALCPAEADCLLAQGVLAQTRGAPADAERAFLRVVTLAPRLATAWHHLGASLRALGRLDESVDAYRSAIRIDPRLAEALNDLSGLLLEQGRTEEAIASLRQAIAANESLPLSHFNLAKVLMAEGRHEEALDACRRAAESDANAVAAHMTMGDILGFLGRLDEAAEAYRTAIDLRPDLARAHNQIGYIHVVQERLDLAFEAFRQALAIDRRYTPAHANIGLLLQLIGRVDEAISTFQKVIGIDGQDVSAHCNLANAYLLKRRFDSALDHLRRASVMRPNESGPHSNLLAMVPYLASHSAEDVAREHRAFGALWEKPYIGKWPRHTNRRAPDRVLNVGYLSSALRRNVQRQNMAPVLRGHNRDRVKVHVYAEIRNPDDITERIKGTVDSWTYIHGLTDDQVAERIRADGIDILVHTMGHFSDNRIMICARKPAPIQVLYICQSPTTGMRAFDCFIADRWLNFDGRLKDLCSEEVIELPDGFQVTEYDEEPTIGPIPALERGHVTFGSFNNPIKISEPCIALWARVLRAVPGSRMFLKGRGLDMPDVAAAITASFVRAGVSADRLSFTAWVAGYDGHLGAHNDIDIALDTFPFGGGRTTEDALWMGVPVVTLVGDSVHGRLGFSHLNRVGVPELCARSEGEFVAIAAALATDHPRLTHYRSTLRDRMKASPILDFDRHIDQLETAYRTMWRRWCATD